MRGSFLFKGETCQEIMEKNRFCNILYPKVWDGLSEDCKDIIMKMLEIDPFKRITIEELLSHKFFANTSTHIPKRNFAPHDQETLHISNKSSGKSSNVSSMKSSFKSSKSDEDKDSPNQTILIDRSTSGSLGNFIVSGLTNKDFLSSKKLLAFYKDEIPSPDKNLLTGQRMETSFTFKPEGATNKSLLEASFADGNNNKEPDERENLSIHQILDSLKTKATCLAIIQEKKHHAENCELTDEFGEGETAITLQYETSYQVSLSSLSSSKSPFHFSSRKSTGESIITSRTSSPKSNAMKSVVQMPLLQFKKENGQSGPELETPKRHLLSSKYEKLTDKQPEKTFLSYKGIKTTFFK